MNSNINIHGNSSFEEILDLMNFFVERHGKSAKRLRSAMQAFVNPQSASQNHPNTDKATQAGDMISFLCNTCRSSKDAFDEISL